MNVQRITIEVEAKTAQKYYTATAEQRRKLNALLSLRLDEIVRSARPLEEVMSEMSRRAQARGLTSEILDQILQEQ